MRRETFCDIGLECRMAMMKATKKPWIAAALAFALGGPGYFYLGRGRGLKATLVWLPIIAFILWGVLGQMELGEDGALHPAFIYFILSQTGLAWMAYRSCKRKNAEAMNAAGSVDPGVMEANGITRGLDINPQRMAEPRCYKKLKDTGVVAIVVSGLALLGCLNLLSLPAMGGMGHFAHDIFAPVVLCMAVWGLATGIGLLRAWRWARISMLVFGNLLAAPCVFMAVPFLVTSGYGVEWWLVLGRRVLGLLFLLVPAVIVVRWHIYFRRDDVRAYFQESRRIPTPSARAPD
jgi:hypothetical protein